jgi:Zn-finger nucleic acid-binding protein
MAHDKHHRTLQCPRDNTPLEEREHEIPGFNVFADHCPKCEGIFLDEDELERLTGKRNVNQLITEYLGVDVGSDLVCPNCGGLMDDEHFKNETGDITIDVCTTCHGVWLDRGELEAIAKLDDKQFDKLSADKRAEVFDQDSAEAARYKGNPLLGAFASIGRGIRQGTRRFR